MVKDDNKKLFISMAIIVIMIAVTIYGCFYVDVNQLLNQIEELPILLKVTSMIFLISLQIVLAFLPGEPLELASGYIFGDLFGTIICLIGSCIGTAVIYYLVHSFRYRIIDVMFKRDKVQEVERLLSSTKSQFWIFVIFLIPGTPKDILSYVASLGDINLHQWVLLTTIGRIPSIVTSTYLSASIKQGNYTMAIIVFVLTVVLVIGGSLLYKHFVTKKNNNVTNEKY